MLTINITTKINFINEWIMILFAHSVATFGIYITSLIFKNSSMYDPFWSVAPIPIVLYLGYFSNNLQLDQLGVSLVVFVVLFVFVRESGFLSFVFQLSLFQDTHPKNYKI